MCTIVLNFYVCVKVQSLVNAHDIICRHIWALGFPKTIGLNQNIWNLPILFTNSLVFKITMVLMCSDVGL